MRIHQGRKTRRALSLALLGLAACLGACSPLAQAPLVYSSKQSLGLDVSTTSTETPGLSINLGFKGVDAAYVPVAVAQQCDINQDTGCDPSKFTLTKLMASTTETDINSPQAQRLIMADTELKAARAALDSRQAEFDRMAKIKKENEDKASGLVDAEASLAKLKAAQTEASKALPATASEEERAIIARAAQETLRPIQERFDAATTAAATAKADKLALEDATIALGIAKKLHDDALTKFEKERSIKSSSLETKREDAFSVFGSFDGKTSFSGTSDNGAGLGVGKVFSTGVASQQLTEGIRAAGCMEAATRAAQAINASKLAVADQQRLILANYKACQPRTVAAD